MGSNLPQRGSSRESVDNLSCTETERIGRAHKDLIARHFRRIREKEKCPGNESNVENIHSRTAKYLFGENNGKRRSYGNHPQRGIARHDHGYQHTRHEEPFLYFMPAPLRHDKLDTETDDIRDDNLGQHGQETEEENRPKTDGRELPYRQIVLVTDIVHTEQQRRHQSQYHNRHGSFRIDTVMDMYPRTGSRRRYIQESFKPLEYRTEHRQPAAGHKVGFYLIEIIS